MGVEVVAPVMGEEKKGLGLSHFEFGENGEVAACPRGDVVGPGRRGQQESAAS